ncbi:hypothetical protein [Kouleothrix sp.]|uniref:hypothetical protein n=1 Tax=Kouleothrix sp. TaxID=2779161 RepID=UPI00391B6B98
MDQPIHPARTPWQLARLLLMLMVCGVAAGLLIWAGQFAAVALVPLVFALLRALEARDRRARVLARRIADSEQLAKVEVPGGAWGDLARAVNGLLQERLVEQRLREALPAPLPLDALQSLLGGDALSQGRACQVAVLLVGAPVRAPAWEGGVRRTGMLAWQVLAAATHDAAQHYGALLQPCGDAVMLVFGAFEERPAQSALRDALAAADRIKRRWHDDMANASPLALALASGYALAAALPGLGFSVVGAPVEQAVGLQQLALRARRFGLMCSEEAYQALRLDPGAEWQPTDLRVALANRPPQVVYRWGAGAS